MDAYTSHSRPRTCRVAGRSSKKVLEKHKATDGKATRAGRKKHIRQGNYEGNRWEDVRDSTKQTRQTHKRTITHLLVPDKTSIYTLDPVRPQDSRARVLRAALLREGKHDKEMLFVQKRRAVLRLAAVRTVARQLVPAVDALHFGCPVVEPRARQRLERARVRVREAHREPRRHHGRPGTCAQATKEEERKGRKDREHLCGLLACLVV
jgi:hypothetical protein